METTSFKKDYKGVFIKAAHCIPITPIKLNYLRVFFEDFGKITAFFKEYLTVSHTDKTFSIDD